MEQPIVHGAVPGPQPPHIGLQGMHEGYDQAVDPPSYSQATKDGPPGYPGPPVHPAAYPGVAPQPTVTQQPVNINTVIVRGVASPVVYHQSYLVMSIVSCLCCFWPLGLMAIIFSIMSREQAFTGRLDQARNHARVALGLNIASFLAGIVCYVVIFLVIATDDSDDDDYYNDK